MAVIVALFMGLIVSAGDINRDRKILKREALLNLNGTSYLLSKIVFFLALSFLQSAMFNLIALNVLEIPNMFFEFFIIFFSVSCFGNILGLLVSYLIESITAIYILVPLIVIPQLLLCGLVINFNDLNQKYTSKDYTPIMADLMVSRWAFEALSVEQFVNNEYFINYYNIEKDISNYSYNLYAWLPMLQDKVQEVMDVNSFTEENNEIRLLNNELEKLNRIIPPKSSSENTAVKI